MTDNPYQPPAANVADEQAAPGSVVKGVLLGGALDLFGTIGVGVLVGLLYAYANAPDDLTPEALDALAAQVTEQATDLGSVWGLTMLGVGLALSLLGGFVCAKFARERWTRAAAILAAVIGLFGFFSALEHLPLSTNLGLSLLSMAAVVFGAWLCVRTWQA